MMKPCYNCLAVFCVVSGMVVFASAPLMAQRVGGCVLVTGDDADDNGHCSYGHIDPDLPDELFECGGLYPAIFTEFVNRSGTGDGVSPRILTIGINEDLDGCIFGAPPPPPFAKLAFDRWNNPMNGGPGAAVINLTDPDDIRAVDFTQFEMIYIPSVCVHTPGGINASQMLALNERQADIKTFVNDLSGSLVALTEADFVVEINGVPTDLGWGWLPLPLVPSCAQALSLFCRVTWLTDQSSSSTLWVRLLSNDAPIPKRVSRSMALFSGAAFLSSMDTGRSSTVIFTRQAISTPTA